MQQGQKALLMPSPAEVKYSKKWTYEFSNMCLITNLYIIIEDQVRSAIFGE